MYLTSMRCGPWNRSGCAAEGDDVFPQPLRLDPVVLDVRELHGLLEPASFDDLLSGPRGDSRGHTDELGKLDSGLQCQSPRCVEVF